MTVARHLVRRELKTDSGVVVSVVREAVALLPASVRRIRVFLHPEDAGLVRQALSVSSDDGDELRWRIIEEPTLTRGGCRVESEDSRIDATVEARLGALIARALGGEREEDAASPAASSPSVASEVGGEVASETPAPDEDAVAGPIASQPSEPDTPSDDGP